MSGKTEIKTRRVVPVLVPMPAERPYSYLVPDDMDVQAGSIVRVPLGPREVAGIVTDDVSDQVDPEKTEIHFACF